MSKLLSYILSQILEETGKSTSLNSLNKRKELSIFIDFPIQTAPEVTKQLIQGSFSIKHSGNEYIKK